MKFEVRVPATTANLGPGFDCLGLALQIWNDLRVETAGNSLDFKIEGEGKESLPANSHNPIFATMQAVAARFEKTLPSGIKIHSVNRIPLGSGLGSSSAAIVAAILAAAKLTGVVLSKEEVLNLAAAEEGHPDNVAPCIFGGLVASMKDEHRFFSRQLAIAPLSFVIVTPDFALPTIQARAALPEKIDHSDAVYNLSHAVLMVNALASGDMTLLNQTMKDRLHQPYRLPLIPGAAEAFTAASSAGAAAVAISGAGSSLLAVLKKPSDAESVMIAMQTAFLAKGINSRTFSPLIDFEGAVIREIM